MCTVVPCFLLAAGLHESQNHKPPIFSRYMTFMKEAFPPFPPTFIELSDIPRCNAAQERKEEQRLDKEALERAKASRCPRVDEPRDEVHMRDYTTSGVWSCETITELLPNAESAYQACTPANLTPVDNLILNQVHQPNKRATTSTTTSGTV